MLISHAGKADSATSTTATGDSPRSRGRAPCRARGNNAAAGAQPSNEVNQIEYRNTTAAEGRGDRKAESQAKSHQNNPVPSPATQTPPNRPTPPTYPNVPVQSGQSSQQATQPLEREAECPRRRHSAAEQAKASDLSEQRHSGSTTSAGRAADGYPGRRAGERSSRDRAASAAGHARAACGRRPAAAAI